MFKVGPHYFLGKPSKGYEGKGFLSHGTDVAKAVFIANLHRRSIVAARLNVSARKRTIINKRSRYYAMRVESDLTDYLEKKRLQMLGAAISALEAAGRAGVEAAIEKFNSTWKGTATVNPETSGDIRDIPSNIGFSVQEFAKDVYGVVIGPVEPSIKMWAQEYGLTPPSSS
jgi:hypothetical protein